MKDWTLPLGMAGGDLAYVLFHCFPVLSPLKPAAERVAADVIPSFMFLMLFFTFCKVNPRELRPRRWHLWLLLIQVAGTFGVVALLQWLPWLSGRMTWEGVLVCLICPTAAAAPVVTAKLGGNETSLTMYTILSNTAAAVVIPLAFPMVEPSLELPFLSQFLLILSKVFPLMIMPLLLAWAVRWLLPRLHGWILRRCRNMAFYLWAFNLTVVIGQALRAMVNGTEPWSEKTALAVAGLVCCVALFAAGKLIGTRYGDRISAGQALGQKNTVFAIWVAYMYLPPVIALAPSSYILWQNIINSWQIERRQLAERRTAGHRLNG